MAQSDSTARSLARSRALSILASQYADEFNKLYTRELKAIGLKRHADMTEEEKALAKLARAKRLVKELGI